MRSRQKRAKGTELRAKGRACERGGEGTCKLAFAHSLPHILTHSVPLCSMPYALCPVLSRGIGILLVVAIAVLIPCFSALTASETAKTTFYDYSSEKVSSDRKNGVTVFEGNAKLKIRDSEDYLNADKVTIYRDVETGELIKMVAVGNVDMKQEGMKATCESATFYETEERIEMLGSEDSPAVIDDDKNRMEAPAITYFRKEDRVEATGNVKGHVTIKAKEGEAEEKAEEKSEK